MFFGLDIHKNFIQVCRLSPDGKERREYQVKTIPADLESFANQLSEADSVVMEVTFVTWPIYSILKKGKAKVVVADSMKVKAIAWARIKSDKVDARVLAHLLRVDFIPEVRMPDQKHWDLRQLISHREGLSKRRAKVKAHAISLLHQNLIDSPYAEKFCIRGIKWLRELSLPQVAQAIFRGHPLMLQT
jgi:transposase